MSDSAQNLLAYVPFVRRLARSLVLDEHHARDIEQEAWLAAVRRPPAASVSVRAWLAGTVRNLAAHARRRDARRRYRELAAERPNNPPGPDLIAEQVEILEHVLSVVRSLDEPYRGTLFLRYFEDLSAADIARRLGVPKSTIRSRLSRALDQVREQLDRRHNGQRATWCHALLPFAVCMTRHTVTVARVASAALVTILVSVPLVGLYRSSAPRKHAAERGMPELPGIGEPVSANVREPLPAGSAAITGHLLDMKSGELLPGVTVQLFKNELDDHWVADAVTATDGWFGFTTVGDNDYTLKTRLEGNEPIVGQCKIGDLARGEHRVIDFSAERRYFIAGLLREEGTGLPAIGVPLRLVRHGEIRAPGESSQEIGESGLDGRFRSEAPVYAGRATVVMSQGARGLYPETYSFGLELRELRIGKEPVDDLSLTFPWTGKATGCVLDPDGSPVAGAMVVALNPNRNYREAPDDWEGSCVVTTRADGTFSMDRLPLDQPLLVAVTATGWARTVSELFEIARGEEPPNVTVRLARLTRLTVHVQDASGDPLPGASVLAYPLEPEARVPRGAALTDEQKLVFVRRFNASGTRGAPRTTDDSGVLDQDLPPGTHRLIAYKDSKSADAVVSVHESQASSVTIRFGEEGWTIAGTAMAADGAPLTKVSVVAGTLAGEAPETACGVDENGRFHLRCLEPGDHSLRIATRAACSEPITVHAPIDDVRLLWTPPAEKTARIHVVDDATGGPIGGATVLLQACDKGLSTLVTWITTASGMIDSPVSVGTNAVYAAKRSYALQSRRVRVHADDSEPVEIELRLTAGHTVRGRVVDQQGVPVRGVQVAVLGAQWFPFASSAVVTRSDGTFTLDSVPEGGGPIGVITRNEIADGITNVLPGATEVVLTVTR